MRKILKWLLIIQEVSNQNRDPKLGRGFLDAERLNPYNPLSYIAVLIGFIVGVIMFGIVGIWEHFKNPFKWD